MGARPGGVGASGRQASWVAQRRATGAREGSPLDQGLDVPCVEDLCSATLRAMATTPPEEKVGDAPAAPRGAIDRFFQITERGSTIGNEIRGGLVTFFTMSYIIVLNPLIIGTLPDSTGQFLGGGDSPNLAMIAAATALIAGILSIAMGLVANFPIALAAGLGLNAVVAYTIAQLPGMTWADAMGIVVLEGLVILALVLTGFRTAVFRAVPRSLKGAIGVGIGLFIALIG